MQLRITPWTPMVGGGIDPPFLTSALGEGCRLHAPSALEPQFTLDRKLGGSHRCSESCAAERISCPCQKSNPGYIDWAILISSVFRNKKKNGRLWRSTGLYVVCTWSESCPSCTDIQIAVFRGTHYTLTDHILSTSAITLQQKSTWKTVPSIRKICVFHLMIIV
jgi:hypothetical protein